MFGPYIDIYDLTRAVDDGATVPVYFEPRLIKVSLAQQITEDDLDRAADEGDPWSRRRRTCPDRKVRRRHQRGIRCATTTHSTCRRYRRTLGNPVEGDAAIYRIPGKALIVGATRDICARLYDEIVALKPDWHNGSESAGVVKVVTRGLRRIRNRSAGTCAATHRTRPSRNASKIPTTRCRSSSSKDMLLTGFDAPPLHTLYLDRPLKGALLMQTLARVNRTFRGKPAGLLVATHRSRRA